MILISVNQIIARLVSMYYHVSNCINDDDITSHHITSHRISRPLRVKDVVLLSDHREAAPGRGER